MDLQSFNAALLAMFNKALTAVEQGASFLAGELPDVVQQFLLYKLVVNAAAWPFFLISLPLAIIMLRKVISYHNMIEHTHNLYVRATKRATEQAIITRRQQLARVATAYEVGTGVCFIIAAISFVVGCMALPDLIKVAIAPKLYIVEYVAQLIRK